MNQEMLEDPQKISRFNEQLQNSLPYKQRTPRSCLKDNRLGTTILLCSLCKLRLIYSMTLDRRKDWFYLNLKENNYERRSQNNIRRSTYGLPDTNGNRRRKRRKSSTLEKSVESIWRVEKIVISLNCYQESALSLPKNLLRRCIKCILMFA